MSEEYTSLNALTCGMDMETRRILYIILASWVFVCGCYVVWHWDFRVVRPIIQGVKMWGWRWLFFG